MNFQSIMKQAQAMQQNMLKEKKKIESTIFEGTSELVDVKMNGKREVIEVKIKNEEKFENEDIEILQDMILISVNDATKKINEEINKKMGNQVGALSSFL